MIKPLHGVDIPNLLFDADCHIGEIVLDISAQLLHALAVVERDDGDGGEEEKDVSC